MLALTLRGFSACRGYPTSRVGISGLAITYVVPLHSRTGLWVAAYAARGVRRTPEPARAAFIGASWFNLPASSAQLHS